MNSLVEIYKNRTDKERRMHENYKCTDEILVDCQQHVNSKEKERNE
jgi:hypothetical protein